MRAVARGWRAGNATGAMDDAGSEDCMGTETLFPGFTARRVRTAGAEIACVTGGSGPPLLLLHGYPQTHAMWHKVAPALARDFTVVCADLRGYGDSSKPVAQPDHAQQSKRAMAQDMVEVMRALGHPRFALAGHDRGGRVAHRLAVDHPDAVDAARGARHLADADDVCAHRPRLRDGLLPLVLPDPAVRPARAADRRRPGLVPAAQDRRVVGRRGRRGRRGAGHAAHFDPRALAEYERCFADPATIHATCEDYRAAASIDLEHDDADVAAGRRVQCPLLALWGDKGVVHRLFDPLADWGEVAVDVRGPRAALGPLPGRGSPRGDAGGTVGVLRAGRLMPRPPAAAAANVQAC